MTLGDTSQTNISDVEVTIKLQCGSITLNHILARKQIIWMHNSEEAIKAALKWPTIDFQHIKLSCIESPFSHIPPRLRGSLSLLCDSDNLYIFGKERFPSQ